MGIFVLFNIFKSGRFFLNSPTWEGRNGEVLLPLPVPAMTSVVCIGFFIAFDNIENDRLAAA
jgi:hypothetical protein